MGRFVPAFPHRFFPAGCAFVCSFALRVGTVSTAGMTQVLRDRSNLWIFGAGAAAVTLGVVLHLPMFWMGRMDHFRLAGMAMDGGMLAGMALIVVGIAAACYGMLPKNLAQQIHASRHISVAAPEDATLSPAHFR